MNTATTSPKHAAPAAISPAPGRYRARPIACGLIDPRQDGRLQMMISFELVSTGQTIEWFGALNPRPPAGSDRSALAITVEALRACGWDGDELEAVTFDPEAEVTIRVAHETWNGRTRARVTSVQRSTLDRLAAAPDQARAASDELRSTIAALPGGAGRRSAPASSRDDDDDDRDSDRDY